MHKKWCQWEILEGWGWTDLKVWIPGHDTGLLTLSLICRHTPWSLRCLITGDLSEVSVLLQTKEQHKSAFICLKQHADWRKECKAWLQNFWNFIQQSWSLLSELLLSVYLQHGSSVLAQRTHKKTLQLREAQLFHNCCCQLPKKNNSSWVTSLERVIHFSHTAFYSQTEERLDWEEGSSGYPKYVNAGMTHLPEVYTTHWCTLTLITCIYIHHKNCYGQSPYGLGDIKSLPH